MSDNMPESVNVEVNAVVAAAVAAVVHTAEAHGEKHSFEYWLEECITNGAKAKLRSWEYSDTTKDAREFTKAIATLSPTAPNFAVEYQKLASKYHVGGTKA